MLTIIFDKANLIICKANEVLIISGRRRKLSDGTQICYRVIKGGRSFKIPILESVSRIPLNSMPIEIRIQKALCKGIIPINIDGRANVKIAGNGQGIPSHVKNLTNSAITILEQIKNATGLDLPGLLQDAARPKGNGSQIPKELP